MCNHKKLLDIVYSTLIRDSEHLSICILVSLKTNNYFYLPLGDSLLKNLLQEQKTAGLMEHLSDSRASCTNWDLFYDQNTEEYAMKMLLYIN